MQGLSITMKSFAVILVLALTSAAGAQPERDTGWDRYRYGEKHETYRKDGDWTVLASPTPTRNGTEYFSVGRDAGRFSQLRIVANDGRVFVRRVTVMFADGGKASYRLERRLGGRSDRDVLIRLGTDKRISQIIVQPDRDITGSYSVYGS
jgi:hypothetical protein